MTVRLSEYRIGNAIFAVQYGDITACQANIIVSSDDNYLSMGGGVSYAISRAAGESMIAEARKQLPLKLGDVAVTSSGKLSCRYILHVVTIDHDTGAVADSEVIRSATRRCLELATVLRGNSIVFPALGTGVARFPFQRCADAMVSAIVEELEKGGPERVTITLYQARGERVGEPNVFYERAIALAAVASGKKGLYRVLEELSSYVAANGGGELHRRFGEFRTLLVDDSPQIPTQATNLYSQTVDFARDAKNVAKDTHWDTRELERKLLQTKYAGCMAQLNVKVSNLNSLEIDKAKYGGVDIPSRLNFAVAELQEDIAKLEQEAHQLRHELSNLALR
jgi:O-acetyl-ADP-ribose deacetylase (regulator of RNase III)